ncbi:MULTISPECIES: tetratricopeptide repeat-containing sensor histidine kinase [Chryseobacterium]|uniref:Oxygen sensor histidine kinase NreB n=1 Tax=Chryseobacterium camelliae TaxID=1265445 RepID=A0ABU0TI65_9FLAO|nr:MULTISPECIES: sensor histidine kinase [Chryseobacterium]MDT3409378.1 two-component system NarL family sensor kinase [Pseudacidovorax intermedius]MDQ1096757.1 two-component system NarL family sensor kinase [Chryseobacterium camelliae]MDQ1100700.1 two-component system NarL family sensor kinase [Chryseobacterium sp. SORGH_AS_1048]MDR6088039.1 two-component system NarL family sensor kinase [Chryseobacterium sp. SORGH_AS_0909]MDR6132413.1 two-component system NarL family sensor kinase [Chryseoba
MKNYYWILMFFWLPVRLMAQQQIPLDEIKYLDSLQNILWSEKPDTLKADACFALVDYWKFRDTVKSRANLVAGKKLAQKYPYYRAVIPFYEGQYYFSSDPAKASAAFKKSIQELASFHDKRAYEKLASAWYNYALMNKDEKGYDFITGITIGKAIPYAEKAGNPVMKGHFYTQLATILMNNAQFGKASDYNQKAVELLEKTAPASSTLLFAYLSGVSIYCYTAQGEKALTMLQKAKKLLLPYPNSINNTLYYYNETLYYTTINALDKALKSADLGIALAEKFHQNQLHQQLVFRKYNIYSQQKNFKDARKILMDIVKDRTLMRNSLDKAMIYGELAKTNEQLKDYQSAYQWLNLQRKITDSINSSESKLKINELETKYRTAQSRQKIAALQAQNRQAALNTKNERLYRGILSIGCLLLFAVLGFAILSARNKRRLAEQKEINYRQQLSEMEQKQQLKVAKAMLDGEELERERIARDLHDGLGGMLAGVKINLSSWAEDQSDVWEDKKFRRTVGQLDEAVSELRRIARNMVPDTLLKFGLETALKDLCEFYMRDGLEISCESFGIRKDIPLNVQLNIYRIIQELISNSIRHSGAANILMQCSQNGSTIFITFEDDGSGFDPDTLKGGKGMGLDNLNNRIAYLKGHLEILSAPDEGTTINIELSTTTDG